MSKVIVLASGGLDSTTVMYSLVSQGVRVVPLFFDYGQHCVEKEWETLHKVLPQHSVDTPVRVDISDIFQFSTSRLIREPNLWEEQVSDNDMYIPYRTLMFFSAASAFSQTLRIQEVYSGFINSNHAKELDCSSAFFNELGEFSEDIGPVRFKLPLRDMGKAEVAKMAEELGVPIGTTYSCQIYSDIPCGACPNCVERLAALKEAELI